MRRMRRFCLMAAVALVPATATMTTSAGAAPAGPASKTLAADSSGSVQKAQYWHRDRFFYRRHHSRFFFYRHHHPRFFFRDRRSWW
jgi:hypothetical protein